MTGTRPASGDAGTRVAVPELSLVVLVGVSGSGKSTFAARHFAPSEVLSSDACRLLVADDANDQDATADAFEVLHFIAGKRLRAGRLTVVDATSVRREDRAGLVALAREHDVLPVAVVLDLPERVCLDRNAARTDRDLDPRVIQRQKQLLGRSVRGLAREGFRRVFVLRTPEEVDAATVARETGWTDRRDHHGPFDLIGDVHGCHGELVTLLRDLGWRVSDDGAHASHPEGRTAVFLGDLVDRGPATPAVLRLAMNMVAAGDALCVPGNHEHKLLRALRGRAVKISHGLAESLAQLAAEPAEYRAAVIEFLDGLISHYVLDGGNLVVAHAGLTERYHGRASARVRDFALYGETTGETDEFGLPVRYPWAEDYRGAATVVYGHTPVTEPRWVNNTICVDTGCVFGGRLTALRYPERELVSVPAERTWYAPVRPLGHPGGAPARQPDAPAAGDGHAAGEGQAAEPTGPQPDAERPADLLDVADVLGKRGVTTRLLPRVTVSREQSLAALEVLSRFALDPRWLIYLPPTMAPTGTSQLPGLLEHPAEAFGAYRHDGVATVVCEEKHMGSRAVVIACRDEAVAKRRFGVSSPAAGVIYTRTGRAFFPETTAFLPETTGGGQPGDVLATEDGPAAADGPARADGLTAAVLDRVRAAAGACGLWEELGTDWLALDCELLPWSAKAEQLLRDQYAAVGASGLAALDAATGALDAAAGRGVDVADLRERAHDRRAMLRAYADAYRRYHWPVASVRDLRLAPFAVLAGEGAVHATRDHRWHMEVAARLAGAGDGLLVPTAHRLVDVTDPDSQAAAAAWWEELTAAGGEGMVVKPLDAVVQGRRGPVQPGVKVRGREYLRIIYGPEYTAEPNLERLRQRSLAHKRSLAQREFALGLESLDRFVHAEPLYRVHECVSAVLALESDPVDPHL